MTTQNVAVLEREKRSTAGRRMSALVGQAAKNDEEFWTHSTWSESNQDGNGEAASEDESFHESDEESEAKVDTFDSDFDDSENDDDEGVDGEGFGVEEEEVLREEKRAKARKRAEKGKQKMFDIVNAGRELMQKRKNAAQRKRALRGEDANAGLILNMPGAAPIVRNINRRADVKVGGVGVSGNTAANAVAVAPSVPGPTSVVKKKSNAASSASSTTTTLPTRRSSRAKSQKFSVAEVVSGSMMGGTKRSLRTSTLNNAIETSTNNAERQSRQEQTRMKKEQLQQQLSSSSRSKSKRRFSQEELLIEAVEQTEAENQRWLLSRKRMMVEESIKADLEKKLGGGHYGKSSVVKVVEKFNSRRGCFNTLTFPEMDHVPEIFTRSSNRSRARATNTNDEKNAERLDWRSMEIDRVRKENTCVITGKRARYRDPKTNMVYHDLDAFRELRRRLDAGEPLLQMMKKEKVIKISETKSNDACMKIAATVVSQKRKRDISSNMLSNKKKDDTVMKMSPRTDIQSPTAGTNKKLTKSNETSARADRQTSGNNARKKEKGATNIKIEVKPHAPASVAVVASKTEKTSSTKIGISAEGVSSSTMQKPKLEKTEICIATNAKVNERPESKINGDNQAEKEIKPKRKRSNSKSNDTSKKKGKATTGPKKGGEEPLISHPEVKAGKENGQKKCVPKNDACLNASLSGNAKSLNITSKPSAPSMDKNQTVQIVSQASTNGVSKRTIPQKTATSDTIRAKNDANLAALLSGNVAAASTVSAIPNTSSSNSNIQSYQPQPIHTMSTPGVMGISPANIGGGSAVPSIQSISMSSMLQAQLAGHQHLTGAQTALSQYANAISHMQQLQQYPPAFPSMMNTNHAIAPYMHQPTHYQHHQSPTASMFSTGGGSIDVTSMLAMNLATTTSQTLPQMNDNTSHTNKIANANMQMEASPSTAQLISQFQNNLLQQRNGGVIPIMNPSSASSLLPSHPAPTTLNRTRPQQKTSGSRGDSDVGKEPAKR